MRTAAVGLGLVFLWSCSPSGNHGGGDADAATTSPCAPSPSTTSFALASWPALTATSATDLTAQAGVTDAPVTGAPAGVLVTRDGDWVLAAAAGAPGQLVVFRRTGTALTLDHSIAMPANETPFGIAQSPDGTTIAVSLSDQVALLDLAQVESNAPGAPVVLVPTQSAMRTTIDVAFTNDGRFVFAALEYDRAVAVIDVQRQTYVGAIPIAGDAVTGVVLSPDGTRLYVTCEESDEFAAANPNPATDQVVGSITVADVATATVTPAASVLGRAFVGRAPVRTIVSNDGATLWVSARGSNAVIALDAASLLSTACEPPLATIAVGPAPVGLAFTSPTRIAVANSNRFLQPDTNQTVMLIDTQTDGGRVLGQIGVGAFPREMDGDGSALFVSNYNSKSISGIDLTGLP